MDVDVKGAAFEGLLEKAASEGKKGAGQYFTPRRLIQSICRVMKPDPRGKQRFRSRPRVRHRRLSRCAYEWLIAETKGAFERADAKRITHEHVLSARNSLPRPRRWRS